MRPQDLGIGRLFERIRDEAIVADAKTQQIVLWNPAAANIFGYSTSEALGRSVEVLAPEYLRDRHREGIARYAETGHGPYIDSHRALELPALKKDGKEIWVELSLSPIGTVGDTDGNEHFVLAIVRDITARKRAEEEIRHLNEDLENRVAERTEQLEATLARLEERERGLLESEERYRTFIEQSTEGIWRFEFEKPIHTNLTPDEQLERFYRHGYLAECNDAMARRYGYAHAEEMVGTRVGDFLPASIQENVEYLRSFIRSGYHLTDAESQEADRHSNIKYFLNNLTGIVENGSLMRVWGTQRDITERKQAEEERSRLLAQEQAARVEAEEAQRRLAFLAEASTVLSSFLDYQDTLASLARLAVPYLADWCVIDVFEEDGSIDRLAMAHQDPKKVALARELQERYPPDLDAPYGVPQALRSGRSELVPEISESLLDETARDAEHREIFGGWVSRLT